MTELLHADRRRRVIEAEAPQYNATLVRRVDQTDDLACFWVRYDGEPTPFEPGQYMTTGVFADGKLWQRPYSVASAPRDAGDGGYEIYVRLVPIIRFTTLLWRLPIGHRMRMIGPKGKFLLEPDDDRTHLFISTGTGIAPFMSMIRDTMAEGRPRKTVVLHGCSYVEELGLPRGARGLAGEPAPTRSPTSRRSAGRTTRATRAGPGGPDAPSTSSIDVCHDLHLRPEKTVVYICGNPDMILNAEVGPDGPRLPRVPRQEGALLAEGQGRDAGRRAEADTPGRDLRPGRNGPAAGSGRSTVRLASSHGRQRTAVAMGWTCIRSSDRPALAQRHPAGRRGPADRPDPAARPVRHRPAGARAPSASR